MLVAMAAQKFGCRPSSLVMLRDPVLALDFDLAATACLLATERKAGAEDGARGEETTPPTQELFW